MGTIIIRLLTVVFALLLITKFLPGFSVDDWQTAAIVALILGLINITIRPILFILTLPLSLITFGLFGLVINAGMFWFVASFVEGFEIDGFIPAFIGALAVTLINWIISKLT